MPWTETCVMEQRIKFVMDVLDGTYSMTELCGYYNISRKTGYKWLDRYQQGGIEALPDRSRAPHTHPNEISRQVKEAILAVKRRFPRWGAPKIMARLKREHPNWDSCPAISTIGLFLRNQNLTCPRKRRRKATPTEPPLTIGRYVNQVWCADFKGHFKTDNGTPFSSRGLGGLSRLSYWWIRLGIYPERIEPGHPEQNGRHERIHKTLKDYTARPAAMTVTAQQKRFDKFRKEYNPHRPHEALQMRTPSDCYSGSPREFPSRLPPVCYPDHMQVKRVRDHGDIRYLGRRLFTTESLGGEYVGIEQTGEDISILWYCDYLLGRIDHRKWQIAPGKSRSLICAYAQISGYKPEKVLPMSSV